MKILHAVMAISFFLSVILNYLFNWIVVPMRMEWEKKERLSPITPEMDNEFYRMNKPMFLYKSKFLDFLVQTSGIVFYMIFSILLITITYIETSSFWRVLLYIPVLYIGLQIMNFITTSVVRLGETRKLRKYGK